MRRPTPSVGVLFAAGLVLAGCGSADSDSGTGITPDASGGGLAVATTTMLGDVAGDLMACAGGAAETLMPIGADPHDFSASSDQIARLVDADLVVANGLGLEAGLADALESAKADGATVLEVAPLVDPIEFGGEDSLSEDGHAGEEDDEHSEDVHAEDEHEHGSLDPHFWHDAARMAQAAELIGAELAELTGEEAYAACGMQVYDALMETDEQVLDILAVIPEDRRVLVTDHDAFGYLAQAYDFEIAGVVIPGGSTLAEPSSQELAELVEVIETEGVQAILSNNANPTDLVPAVAEEADTDIKIVELFIGSLGPDGSGAETYTGMVTSNAQRIADVLG